MVAGDVGSNYRRLIVLEHLAWVISKIKIIISLLVQGRFHNIIKLHLKKLQFRFVPCCQDNKYLTEENVR